MYLMGIGLSIQMDNEHTPLMEACMFDYMR